MNLKVEAGIPIPDRNYGKGRIGTGRRAMWPTLNVGDSVFLPLYAMGAMARRQPELTRFSSHELKQSAPGFKWTTRSVTENNIPGTRVWRIA